MTSFSIQPLDPTHKQWAEDFVSQEWGSLRVVSRGKLYNALDYPGFVAVVDGEPQGIIIYRLEDGQCEVLLLHSAMDNLGIGSALVAQVKQLAEAEGCMRLWLITTNDNIRAFRWYQRRGFTIAAVHVNALAQSRKLKPEIPLTGNEGIPLRDEIEFEIRLR